MCKGLGFSPPGTTEFFALAKRSANNDRRTERGNNKHDRSASTDGARFIGARSVHAQATGTKPKGTTPISTPSQPRTAQEARKQKRSCQLLLKGGEQSDPRYLVRRGVECFERRRPAETAAQARSADHQRRRARTSDGTHRQTPSTKERPTALTSERGQCDEILRRCFF
jgi:hypothetical protein